MNIRELIFREFSRVAFEQKKAIVHLDDDVSLINTGLDSLCFAILVARLEDQIGADPFSASDEPSLPTTVGELVKLYEDYVSRNFDAQPEPLPAA